MVWAGFCFSGKTEIVFRPSKGKAEVYQDLLEMHLRPFIRRLGGGRWIFQQDGATVHTANSTMQWFASRKIEVLPWPALSPDLNPLENLWGELVRRVYDNGRRQFDSVPQLSAAIEESWNAIELSVLENLVESMPERIFEVIKNGGRSTRF